MQEVYDNFVIFVQLQDTQLAVHLDQTISSLLLVFPVKLELAISANAKSTLRQVTVTTNKLLE